MRDARYRDERGDDWADIIDMTLDPQERRRIVGPLGAETSLPKSRERFGFGRDLATVSLEIDRGSAFPQGD